MELHNKTRRIQRSCGIRQKANNMSTINIKDLTLGQLDELKSILSGSPPPSSAHPFQIGKTYFLRTVTHHFTGRLKAVYPTELVLTDAAWIADDGRFSTAVKEGEFNEVEPYADDQEVVIGRASLIDATIIASNPPRSQK